jgi:hypothetical protein
MTSTVLHFPFVCAVILSSTALRELVAHTEVAPAVAWFWSGGLAAAVLCLGLLSYMHKSLDKHGSGFLPHGKLLLCVRFQTEIDLGGRVSARLLWSIIFACLPLSKTLRASSKLLGTTTALLGALVFIEVGSKLGVHPCPDACETYFDEGIAVPMGREGETEHEAALADALAQGDPPSKDEEAGAGLSGKALQQIDVKYVCERRKKMAEVSSLH